MRLVIHDRIKSIFTLERSTFWLDFEHLQVIRQKYASAHLFIKVWRELDAGNQFLVLISVATILLSAGSLSKNKLKNTRIKLNYKLCLESAHLVWTWTRFVFCVRKLEQCFEPHRFHGRADACQSVPIQARSVQQSWVQKKPCKWFNRGIIFTCTLWPLIRAWYRLLIDKNRWYAQLGAF